MPDGGAVRALSAPPGGSSALPGALVPPTAGTLPASLGGIAPVARFGKEMPITSGVVWRVYTDKPDSSGNFRLVKEERGSAPTIVLPPGGYVVHAALGFASASKRVQVRSDIVRETLDLPAGGVRFEGRVSDARIPDGQITFDIFSGSQLETGEKRPIVSEVPAGNVVVLPEGGYHVVSNYGDGNAVMRHDFRVTAGKLMDARINHRAAMITLKLLSERGGEAVANTSWSVLTPGGDVIEESIGAFPSVVLAEGEYVAIARNEGKAYNRQFKVEPGFDREIELLAR